MDKQIEKLIQKIVLRDVELRLLAAKENDEIVPDNIFEILKDLEQEYDQNR